MITIYIHGCSTCGVNTVYIRRVKKYGEDNGVTVDVKNSKYDTADLARHANLLLYSGLSMSDYTPIVVDNGVVTQLRAWNKC